MCISIVTNVKKTEFLKSFLSAGKQNLIEKILRWYVRTHFCQDCSRKMSTWYDKKQNIKIHFSKTKVVVTRLMLAETKTRWRDDEEFTPRKKIRHVVKEKISTTLLLFQTPSEPVKKKAMHEELLLSRFGYLFLECSPSPKGDRFH